MGSGCGGRVIVHSHSNSHGLLRLILKYYLKTSELRENNKKPNCKKIIIIAKKQGKK